LWRLSVELPNELEFRLGKRLHEVILIEIRPAPVHLDHICPHQA
jgi:hypothetical protein